MLLPGARGADTKQTRVGDFRHFQGFLHSRYGCQFLELEAQVLELISVREAAKSRVSFFRDLSAFLKSLEEAGEHSEDLLLIADQPS